MVREGPCLRHCYCPFAVLMLAHLALLLFMTIALYLAYVGCSMAETPLQQSLTPWQVETQRKSVYQRIRVLCVAAAVSALILLVGKPLYTSTSWRGKTS